MTKRVADPNQLAMFAGATPLAATRDARSDRSRLTGSEPVTVTSVTTPSSTGSGSFKGNQNQWRGVLCDGLVVPKETLHHCTSHGADVLRLRAALWPALPLPATLCCSCWVPSLPVYLTSSATVWKALRRCNRVVFGLSEWAALLSAYEEGRASPTSFAEWCVWKRGAPTWRVTIIDALGGVVAGASRCDGSTVGAVLRGWGAELVGVSYGAEVPS